MLQIITCCTISFPEPSLSTGHWHGRSWRFWGRDKFEISLDVNRTHYGNSVSSSLMPNNAEDEKTLQYKIGDLPLHSSVSQRLVSVCIPSASTPGQLDSFLDVQNRSRIMEHPLSQGPHSVQWLHPPSGAVWEIRENLRTVVHESKIQSINFLVPFIFICTITCLLRH